MKRALIFIVLAACRHAPSEDDCGRLLDHFLDVEGKVATDGRFTEMTPPMTAALAGGRAEQRARIGADFVDRCQRELTRADVECALTAESEPGLDDCVK